MADYIYLLENRLSQSQQNALNHLRTIARDRGLTIFLVGGAVRDLTSGFPVRDLDVVVQGNALKLKKDIERVGGAIVGEHDAGQALFVTFPGGAKVEVGSTLSATYPKPGKPVLKPASILDDLRRRDFTANSMAISLNTGSYGLLMDPLNGVADIENRELRLVSNYGFIEDPIRMVRAVRLMARLGWQMDEKTQARYATGKEEGYISVASAFQRGYEIEEIVHEEDPLRVMAGLEAEGWMAILAPYWTSAKVNVSELERLRESQTQLQLQGIHPNSAAANFPLLTAKLSATEVADLKATFARPGFVREIEALDAEAKEFATHLTARSAALPSQSWKLLHSAKPEAVLQVAHSSKSPAIQAKFKSFYMEWPLARQKVPYALLQEMRITPELTGYQDFVDSLVFELMDGKLETVEEMKAFLEPFSPPAPPPPIHLRRPRAAKKESKTTKSRAKKVTAEAVLPAEVSAERAAAAIASAGGPAESTQVPAAPAEPAVPKNVPEKKVASLAPVTEPIAPKATPIKGPAVTKQSAAKKTAAAKKSAPAAAAKKAVPPKSPVKAVGIKKPAAGKNIAAKSSSVRRPVAKKAVASKVAPKVPAKKLPAKKSATKKTALKMPVKAAAAKKTAAKVPSRSSAKKASKGNGKKRR